MPLYHRTYSQGQLQFITTSTYRRAPVSLPAFLPLSNGSADEAKPALSWKV
jgi:hypothetical protein